MDKSEILNVFSQKGFLLERGVLDFLSRLDGKRFFEFFDIFVKLRVEEKVIGENLFNKYKDDFVEILNRESSGFVKVLSSCNFSNNGVGVKDFVNYFRVRFEKMKSVLEKRDFKNLSAIRRVGDKSGVYSIVGMVFSKRVTKNGNLLLEIEDLSGRVLVLVNRDDFKLFELARNLMLDSVVVFRVSGSRRMLFVSDIIFPEVKLDEKRFFENNEYVAFSGDLHVGSDGFLEENFLRFVSWLNGEIGDEKEREDAKRVKYLFLAGDCVEGVGVFAGQERFLSVKSYEEQYEKFAEILKKIRGDLKIIVCVGQHDAVWVGEPQGVIPKRFASKLYDIKNLILVSNPSLIEIDCGLRVLMYHGASINRFVKEMFSLKKLQNGIDSVAVVREMLKEGHLAPTYGVMDYFFRNGRDDLVVDFAPDVFFVGDQHRAEVGVCNNVLVVAGSCWQERTAFQKKMGEVPVLCKVPLFNLKTREIRVLDFGGEKIKEIEDGEVF